MRQRTNEMRKHLLRVAVRVEPSALELIDARAEAEGISRAEAAKQILEWGATRLKTTNGKSK